MAGSIPGENGGGKRARSAIVRSVRSAVVSSVLCTLFVPALALADDLGLGAGPTQPVTADQAKAALSGDQKSDSILPQAPLEAPPAPPHKTGLVLSGSMGALGFLGKFKNVAPPAVMLQLHLGYEIFRWLMPFVSGELSFTDTSNTIEKNGTDPSKTRAFPIFGFGGGVRFTIPIGTRVGIFAQGDIGAMQADITKYALANMGYGNAEKLGLYYGGKLGLEWYQVDRHMGLGLQGGARVLSGFARTIGSDTALGWDAAATIRYAF